MIFPLAFPRIMRIGGGASRELPALLQQLGLSRPFLMTDRYMMASGLLVPVIDSLSEAGIKATVFADTVPEPDVLSIERAAQELVTTRCDSIVAFGGGSPIDSAKAVSVLATFGGAMADYRTPHIQDSPGLPVIAIPTTAGTGSEATRFTVVTDTNRDEKMLCAGLAYLPVAALVDFELTLSKPPRLTADTGIDALTHAIEAYVSRRATPVSDIFAMAAIRAIAPNLRAAFVDGQDRFAREQLMFGATCAGIAFSNSSVAMVHGMSRPIGAHFHVPHGLSNAMLLPLVTQFSAPGNLVRYAQCARAMGTAGEDEGDQMAVSRLITELTELNRDLQVPSPQQHGIDQSKWDRLIPLMAEQALASGSPDNNPRIPTEAEIRDLYKRAWQSS